MPTIRPSFCDHRRIFELGVLFVVLTLFSMNRLFGCVGEVLT